jgi:hypothetical protein
MEYVSKADKLTQQVWRDCKVDELNKKAVNPCK